MSGTNVIDNYGVSEMQANAPLKLGTADGKGIQVRILPIAQAEVWVKGARDTMRVGKRMELALKKHQTAEAELNDPNVSEEALALEEVLAQKSIEAQDEYFTQAAARVEEYMRMAQIEINVRENMTVPQAIDAFESLFQLMDPMNASLLLHVKRTMSMAKEMKTVRP